MRAAIPLTALLASAPALAQDPAPIAAAGTWLSLLPPLLAIAVALLLRHVIPALFAGVWLGAILVRGLAPEAIWLGLLDTLQRYIVDALADRDHAAIVLFTFMIGGMVGIVSRNGGLQGIVDRIAGWASDARRACLATAGMGLAIFFDDYANTLVVGNTMRPITDRMRTSRAKLAYIVDSTAAPVTCVALVTTWIGYEVGLIGDALASIPDWNEEAYLVFLNTLPYSFYPLLAIFMVLLVCTTGRDFGPMLAAERATRQHGVIAEQHLRRSSGPDTETPEPVEGKPHRARNAIVPIVVLVLTVLAGLWVTGRQGLGGDGPHELREIIGASDSYTALLWASLLAVLTAAGLTWSQRILDLDEIVQAWYAGMRSMMYAMIILLLAWSLGEITTVLDTAGFLVETIGDTVPARVLPALVFVLAALTAFATGTSWGVMAILTPLVVPLSWEMLQAQGLAGPEHMHLAYSAIASVLAGAVWGDHCSPISDTTVLSSMASGCDHIEHVRTQLPYALLVGFTALLTGSIAVAQGLPWWGGLVLGAIVLATCVFLLGRIPPDYNAARENAAAARI